MTHPRIVPTPFPLRQQPDHRLEEMAWRADKLREAFALGGKPFSDLEEANRIYAALDAPPVPINRLSPDAAWRIDDRPAGTAAGKAYPGERLDEFERHGAAQALALILFTLIGSIIGGAIVWLFTRSWGVIL